jgi:hypothetical protein
LLVFFTNNTRAGQIVQDMPCRGNLDLTNL